MSHKTYNTIKMDREKARLEQENARLKELNREMVEALKRECEACEYTFYREKDSTTFEDLDCSECSVKQLLTKAEREEGK